MAGGKETPRQKMIGMMYLVLTALLALNVSKQILDAFVAIEANIYKGAIVQLGRGDGFIDGLELAMLDSTDKSMTPEAKAQKKEKISAILKSIKEIDIETAKVIKEIDEIKIHLLDKVGEDVKTVKPDDDNVIVWTPYDAKYPLRPAKLNLAAINSKDNFDVPTHELIHDLKPVPESSKAIKLWNVYNNFRKILVEKTGTYKDNGKQYTVSIPGKGINDFNNYPDLEKKVKDMLKKNGNNVNPVDLGDLATIYAELTKKEFDVYKNGDSKTEAVHWMGRTFYHAPVVGALASLTSLQFDVLSARAKALGMMASREAPVAQYSFNQIQGIAYAKNVVVNPGDPVEVEVFMAAFDSDKQPKVNLSGASVTKIENGKATARGTAPSAGEMTITGNVAIQNKNGDWVQRDFEPIKIAVAAKGGSIELPEMKVLYKDYNNILVPTATGAVSTSITGASRSGNYEGKPAFTLRPNSLGTVSVSLTGKDASGNTLSFGSYTYKVKDMPNADVVVTAVSKSMGGAVMVGTPNGVILDKLSFTLVDWSISGGGSGTGNRIPASAVANFKLGQQITVFVNSRNSLTGKVSKATRVVAVSN